MRALVPLATVTVYPAGKTCTTSVAGDLVLVRDPGAIAAAIRFFERIRRPRGTSKAEWASACKVNHACIIVAGGRRAIVSQEEAAGDVLTSLANLDAKAYAVVHLTTATDIELHNLVNFARRAVGSGYGWLSIAADAFNALTGLEMSFGIGNRMVCSTQSCRALERAGLIPDRSPYAVTPAHLACYFQAGV